MYRRPVGGAMYELLDEETPGGGGGAIREDELAGGKNFGAGGAMRDVDLAGGAIRTAVPTVCVNGAVLRVARGGGGAAPK